MRFPQIFLSQSGAVIKIPEKESTLEYSADWDFTDIHFANECPLVKGHCDKAETRTGAIGALCLHYCIYHFPWIHPVWINFSYIKFPLLLDFCSKIKVLASYFSI